MSHNNVITICTFGFVIWFVPSEFWYHCFLFYYIDWRRQQQLYTFIFWLRLADLFLLDKQSVKYSSWTICPSVSWDPLVRSPFSGDGSRKFRKKGQSPPLSRSNENFTSAWLYNYKNHSKNGYKRWGRTKTFWKYKKKRGTPAPWAPPLNPPMLLNAFLGEVG